MNIVKLMNDFTKEELKLIIDKLGLLRFSQFEGCGKLVNKIQSMIDNYCEHMWTDGSGNSIYCVKCHALGGKR